MNTDQINYTRDVFKVVDEYIEWNQYDITDKKRFKKTIKNITDTYNGIDEFDINELWNFICNECVSFSSDDYCSYEYSY
ncbi:MAG: hypothetical protein CL489_10330 [Acidobacteria bacterium]|nr:hypothetical protein [Acidobacteriota bacterium]|tara:strand:+ start:12335 stop:12571 length:237 start_codon:yes stop_codon:yes gene_type:complete